MRLEIRCDLMFGDKRGVEREYIDGSARLSSAGYKVVDYDVVYVDSLEFFALCRQVDIIVMSCSLLSDIAPKRAVEIMAEVRGSGCRFCFFDPGKINSGVAQVLGDFGYVAADMADAIREACGYIDRAGLMAKKESGQRFGSSTVEIKMREGKPVSYIVGFPRIGDVMLEETTGLCAPHPFSSGDDQIDLKLSFIAGYGAGKLIMSGILRVEGHENQAGYVVDESLVDLPNDWRKRWSALALSSGCTEIQNGVWTIAMPNQSTKTAPVRISDVPINGRYVVQPKPFAFCVFDGDHLR